MRTFPILTAILLLAGSCSSAPHTPVEPASKAATARRIVVVVSIDGLIPASYLDPETHGLRVPTLRQLRSGGAYSEGAISVFPTVTYPAHTSMVTGVNPGVHGIIANHAWDPYRRNQEGWNWYAESIRVPTLWQVAERAGVRTALVHWPASVGAQVHALVPDFWRAKTQEDVKLSRAVSTPGLLDRVATRFPGFWDYYEPWKPSDRSAMDVAIHLIESGPPELMFIHTLKVDQFQHGSGLWSAEAKAQVEEADSQLARLMDALKRTGLWNRTILVVVSDHGFLPVRTRVRPAHVLKELGLTPRDEDSNLTSWKASLLSADGIAYLYVADENDGQTKELLHRTFVDLASKPDSGVERVYQREEIRARGGDPNAFLAIEASDGFRFSSGYGGETYTDLGNKGVHGYSPERPEMRASLLVYGPSVKPGVIAGARLIDLAPTIAGWLGLAMPGVEGRALPIVLEE